MTLSSKQKRILLISAGAVILLLVIAYVYVFIVPVSKTNIYKLVPEDAMFISEIDEPVESWDEFDQSEIWQFLSTNEKLSLVGGRVESLRSLMESNRSYFKRFAKGRVLISGHMIARNDYSYLYLIDVGNASKLGHLDGFVGFVSRQGGYKVISHDHKGTAIKGLYTENPNDALYIAFVENVLVCSYYEILVKKSIDQHAQPFYNKHEDFLKVNREVNGGLAELYIAYEYADEFVGVYTATIPAFATLASKMLNYTGTELSLKEDRIAFDGYTGITENTPNLFKSLHEAGKAEIEAHEVLPPETAFMLSIGFDDYQGLRSFMDHVVPKKSRSKMVTSLGMQLENWSDTKPEELLGKEISLALVPDAEGKLSTVLIIPDGNDVKNIQKKLDKWDRGIGGLPSLFSKKDKWHRGIRTRKIPIRGLLNQFLGGNWFLSDIPAMAYVNNDLVIADDRATLTRIIDVTLDETTLAEDEEFEDFFSEFDKQSNFFLFIRTHPMLEYSKRSIKSTKQQLIRENEYHIKAFPLIGIQLTPKKELLKTRVLAIYERP